jgi:hypothetical protein
VLPGHGKPWSGGVPEALRRYRASSVQSRSAFAGSTA